MIILVWCLTVHTIQVCNFVTTFVLYRCNSPGQLLHLDQLFNSHVVAGTNTSHLEAPQAAPAASDDSNDSGRCNLLFVSSCSS